MNIHPIHFCVTLISVLQIEAVVSSPKFMYTINAADLRLDQDTFNTKVMYNQIMNGLLANNFMVKEFYEV